MTFIGTEYSIAQIPRNVEWCSTMLMLWVNCPLCHIKVVNDARLLLTQCYMCYLSTMISLLSLVVSLNFNVHLNNITDIYINHIHVLFSVQPTDIHHIVTFSSLQEVEDTHINQTTVKSAYKKLIRIIKICFL